MAPASRLLTLAVVIVTWAGGSKSSSIAAPPRWHLADTYDASNFFTKFDFFTDKSGDAGYSVFQNESEAFRKGLVAYQDDQVYIGPDHRTVLKGACEPDSSPGRDSVRIESKARYNHGLVIARFTHTPQMKCGLWPAFWTYGNNWPRDGEIDLLEGYNLNSWNQPTFRVAETARSGRCKMDGADQAAYVHSGSCDEVASRGNGCSAVEAAGLTEPNAGSVYAMEWTSEFIKIYRWRYDLAPRNVDDDSPDTSAWGRPLVYLKNKDCNIDRHFANQRIVLDLDFCGNPAGMPDIWNGDCRRATRETNCVDYVAKNPGVFRESYFKIKDIRYFQDKPKPRTTTPTSSSTLSIATPTKTVLPTTTPVRCFFDAPSGCDSELGSGVYFVESSIAWLIGYALEGQTSRFYLFDWLCDYDFSHASGTSGSRYFDHAPFPQLCYILPLYED
ncbi:glycosyl hydrolases family 16 domain-containing protein [Hirsutella rhossiliensis]|uniref:Glycosyl hydrolases family 16 domain-containing protein n=1 Tax=Hirsutella rhossiliensis TaxID=111463 RepID=A0A9P8MVC4_9HYPO|nr:glycosyl hydrolases family 16 domain-containing protein [Hirsutella rhossiliensis]KAH0961945.1 glycosyl hydrolases family 16 domain-containing protein [Hirsutella rhossiliensis]